MSARVCASAWPSSGIITMIENLHACLPTLAIKNASAVHLKHCLHGWVLPQAKTVKALLKLPCLLAGSCQCFKPVPITTQEFPRWGRELSQAICKDPRVAQIGFRAWHLRAKLPPISPQRVNMNFPAQLKRIGDSSTEILPATNDSMWLLAAVPVARRASVA